MFFFKRTEDQAALVEKQNSELESLLSADRADREALAALQQQLEGVRPEWLTLQARAEEVAARLEASDRCYSRSVYEAWWAQVDPGLQAKLDRLIAQRDGLTVLLVGKIAEIKNRRHRRHSRVVGAFWSWAQTISQQAPALAGEINEAKQRLEKSDDLGEIVDDIESWIERVAAVDDGPTTLPILNFPRVIREAAGT